MISRRVEATEDHARAIHKLLNKKIDGLSNQSELARALGVTRSLVNHWSRGRHVITADIASKLCKLIDNEMTLKDFRPDLF